MDVQTGKHCTRCLKLKAFENFAKGGRQAGLQHWCRQCQKEYSAARWKKFDASTRQRQRMRVKAAAKKRLQRNTRNLLTYLANHPCVDCGENDPLVLDFDHVRGEKVREVSQLVIHASWKRVEEEIEKCVVRCANCHRRKTALERNTVKVQFSIGV